MAPSVAELSGEASPVAVLTKSLPERPTTVEAVRVENDSAVKPPAPVEEVVAVEASKSVEQSAQDTVESKPKIRRIIDEEGGTTTASVSGERQFADTPTLICNLVPSLPPSMGSWREVSSS